MRRIAIINQKGGVGKTTTTAHLAAALAQAGKKTFLIDLDPQGHLSLHFGLNVQPDQATVYDVLTASTPIAEARVAVRENIDVLPADIDLAAAEAELVSVTGREVLLREAVDAFGNGYDALLIDCAPSLGVLTINALAACTEVVIPLQAHFFGLQGLSKLLETVMLVRQRINPQLKVSGIALCMHEASTRLATEIAEDLTKFLEAARGSDKPWAAAQLYRTPIRRNIKLAESSSFGQTVFDYAPRSNGAMDYANLAAEIFPDLPKPAAMEEEPDAAEPVVTKGEVPAKSVAEKARPAKSQPTAILDQPLESPVAAASRRGQSWVDVEQAAQPRAVSGQTAPHRAVSGQPVRPGATAYQGKSSAQVERAMVAVSQISDIKSQTAVKSRNLKSEISTMQSEESKLKSKKSEESNLKSKIPTIKSEESSLKSKIPTIKSEESNLKSEISTIKSEESNLESKISKAESREPGPKSGISNLKSEISNVKLERSSLTVSAAPKPVPPSTYRGIDAGLSDERQHTPRAASAGGSPRTERAATGAHGKPTGPRGAAFANGNLPAQPKAPLPNGNLPAPPEAASANARPPSERGAASANGQLPAQRGVASANGKLSARRDAAHDGAEPPRQADAGRQTIARSTAPAKAKPAIASDPAPIPRGAGLAKAQQSSPAGKSTTAPKSARERATGTSVSPSAALVPPPMMTAPALVAPSAASRIVSEKPAERPTRKRAAPQTPAVASGSGPIPEAMPQPVEAAGT